LGLKIKDKNYIIISVLGIIIFSLFLGQVNLFDWDEINFAESAREMLVTGDFLTVQINFEPFWEKPPLFIWMQAISMWIFGVNEFAARFPNAICGVVTLLVLYRMGKELNNKTFGLIWVLSYACSFLPFFYFKSGIIDPWFNLFIFLGIYHEEEHVEQSYRVFLLVWELLQKVQSQF
jgi:4-amino-4-deoxy-L-arabinose transferase-like glycosyltransferase